MSHIPAAWWPVIGQVGAMTFAVSYSVTVSAFAIPWMTTGKLWIGRTLVVTAGWLAFWSGFAWVLTS